MKQDTKKKKKKNTTSIHAMFEQISQTKLIYIYIFTFYLFVYLFYFYCKEFAKENISNEQRRINQ